uniref:thioredoxin-dependent peroxiredoxin n=1 Tax=Brassica oleracea TaxID=3712 RepID=A0A3P6FYP8_BRAOL|nr:unnamed protein product [Brassica oleracea]
MASVTSPTTLISSSTRAFPAKSYSPTSPSVSFLRTLSSPSSSASLRSAFAQRSSLSSSSRRSFAVKAQTVSLSQCRHFLVPLCLKIRVHYIGSVESLETDDLPLVGNKAPDFEAEAVFDQEFIKVKLSEYIGKKYVILFFYPLDFTFVCPTEITAFSDRYAEFEKLNTEVLGVSVDSVFSHLAWVQTDRKSGGLGDLNYPLISDVTKSISKSFGVLIHDQQGIALRGLFIIDKEGVIQHSTINNLGIGRSVDETMRTLQALQYIQENPDEVCPAGWKPGEKSMKPDPKLSKEYFSAI